MPFKGFSYLGLIADGYSCPAHFQASWNAELFGTDYTTASLDKKNVANVVQVFPRHLVRSICIIMVVYYILFLWPSIC